MQPSLSQIRGREVLDSRGNPTVEAEVRLSDGSFGRAIVPSGASKGHHEALELRDGDKTRYHGKGVLAAVRHVGEIAKALGGKTFSTVSELDYKLLELDGTKQKSKLGANTLLAVSLAYAHALAASRKQTLFQLIAAEMGLDSSAMRMPVPLMNVLNGGLHADNGLEFQEFMIVPHGFTSFSEALRAGTELFQSLKTLLHDKKLSTAVGDEGGFAPALESNERALELLCEAIESAGYRPGEQISLALDVAATSFFDEGSGRYLVKSRGDGRLGSQALLDYYGELAEKYPLVSIEDGLQEEDWDGWKAMTRRFGDRLQLVGDDLFVTNKAFLQRGIEEKAANAVLIKVNQIGTLTETIETMTLARENHYRSVVSHRSGETEDVTIAHLAVASGCGQIKTGSLSRSERTAKYNELLRIEEYGRETGRPIPYASFPWGKGKRK